MKARAVFLLCVACGCAPGAERLSVDASGNYRVRFASPAWSFGGSLGSPATRIARASGADAMGAYHEITFEYDAGGARRGGVRAYDTQPIAIFTGTYLAAAANSAPFPTLSDYPRGLHHVSYGEKEFAPFSFETLTPDSPWVFFDDDANAFIVSAATHFLNAATRQSADGAIASGIDPAIATLPAGFEQQTILVAQPGINAAYETWGGALLARSGKTRPANDATVDLERFGYWTDNGATYYYNFDKARGYAGTLLAVRDDFKQQGIPLAYVQLDSWWYPKGAARLWSDKQSGEYTYTADPALFPNGLGAFQKTLGLPLVTHARWIDPASPYRAAYSMSNNVSTDSGFWSGVADYLQTNGVVTYEQDWLNQNALPLTDNLADQDAFLDGMAAATTARGVQMQYCMPLPRHYLQSTRYANLLTTRVSGDRFDRTRWQEFFYASRLASALGEWPWVDVFLSAEEDNLLLATLSAGMVGVGDPMGGIHPINIAKSIRADGVIVKPDLPIVPLDQTFVDGAKGAGTPVVGAARTDHGAMRASYVFAFSTGPSATASFSPASLGFAGSVYVFNHFKQAGKVVSAAEVYREDVENGRAYWIVVPIGPSGIAFLGDAGKFVSLGKKRVTELADDGTLSATLAFATGEPALTLHGYAPQAPKLTVNGAPATATWDPATRLFTATVTAAGATATITLR